METNRKIVLVLAIAAVMLPAALLCWAEQKKDEKSIWTEDEQRGPRPGPRPGPGPGPGQRRFELTDEEVDRITTSLKKSDPEKAKELAKLRKKEPEKFQAELRRYGREEFGKIIKGRIEGLRQKRQAEFIIWLEKNYSKEAKSLVKLKENDPNLYMERFDSIRRQYGPIFDAERVNPELAEVLKEDLALKKKRDELIRQIKASSNEQKKKGLILELEEVVASRFDLIIQRKQIAYERLLKRLEELRNRVKESRNEIAKWMDDKFKAENIKKRLKDLNEGIPQFSWD